MQSITIYTFAILMISILALSQAAPLSSSTILSSTDISGEPVREKRATKDYYQGDYFICYPSSAVYGQRGANRRSDDRISGLSAFDSFEARKDRADRERAAYTDSYGK